MRVAGLKTKGFFKLFGGVGAVYRHELRLLLFAPLSYLFQIVFLIVLAACTFLIADFYNTDDASVKTMLTFLPWVSLILRAIMIVRIIRKKSSIKNLGASLNVLEIYAAFTNIS